METERSQTPKCGVITLYSEHVGYFMFFPSLGAGVREEESREGKEVNLMKQKGGGLSEEAVGTGVSSLLAAGRG